jgi:hypothetical protein
MLLSRMNFRNILSTIWIWWEKRKREQYLYQQTEIDISFIPESLRIAMTRKTHTSEGKLYFPYTKNFRFYEWSKNRKTTWLCAFKIYCCTAFKVWSVVFKIFYENLWAAESNLHCDETRLKKTVVILYCSIIASCCTLPFYYKSYFTVLCATIYKLKSLKSLKFAFKSIQKRDTLRRTQQEEARRSHYNPRVHPRDLHI